MDNDRAFALVAGILAGEIALAGFLLVFLSVLGGHVIATIESVGEDISRASRRQYHATIASTAFGIVVTLIAALFTATWFARYDIPLASVFFVFALCLLLAAVSTIEFYLFVWKRLKS